MDPQLARRCIAIVTNERRASYVIPLNSSWVAFENTVGVVQNSADITAK